MQQSAMDQCILFRITKEQKIKPKKQATWSDIHKSNMKVGSQNMTLMNKPRWQVYAKATEYTMKTAEKSNRIAVLVTAKLLNIFSVALCHLNSS